jgi:hypothetical protein
MRKSLLSSILVLFFILSAVHAWAEEVYVKNKLFEGEVVGQGLSSELNLEQLAAALELELARKDGAWLLGETVVLVREQDGRPYVKLSDLRTAGFKVIHSPELGIIDVNTGKGPIAAGQPQQRMSEIAAGGSLPTLVYFGADW